MIFTNKLTARVEYAMGNDETIARMARVSTGADLQDQTRVNGLINYLWKSGHTSPFSHPHVTFYIEAPLFVARQIMRHRTGNYSEVSLRYSEAEPKFYIPDDQRPLKNAGSSAHPDLQHDDAIEYDPVRLAHEYVAEHAWDEYESMVESGVANEVARNVLPVTTYTRFYMTMSLSNWFKFLELRDGKAGHPQYEIVQIAEKITDELRELYPLATAAFEENR